MKNRKIEIAPSLLASDLSRLADEVKALEEASVDVLHLDIMDGHFVPNLTFGLPVIESLRRHTKLPFDAHLMIENADRYLEEFKRVGCNWLSVHVETCPHLNRTVSRIRELGMSPGVALNPGTSLAALDAILGDVDFVLVMTVNPGFGGQKIVPQAFDRIRALKAKIGDGRARIQVDGGIKKENAAEAVAAGADILVMGTGLFSYEDYRAGVTEIRQATRRGGEMTVANVSLDGNTLTLEALRSIVENRAKVSLSKPARERLGRGRAVVDRAIESGERVYSINTGFGILSKVTIDPKSLDQLQENLIRSHCVGVAEPHTEAESRSILLLRTNVLAKGFSGARAELVDRLIAMLNAGVHPVIPSKGSVGASGDLAPLAHLASVLLGEGEAFYDGRRMPGGEALKLAGIEPIRLAPKEGLSLINGTQQMTGVGALTLLRAEQLADIADLVCASSLDGVLGTPRAYLDWVQRTRAFPGQILSARNLRTFVEGSQIFQSHLKCDRVQDPYSFRCAPQVHGASRDLLTHVRRTLEVELNAATDNPLVNPDTGELVSNGNFHGQPVAFALDILAMALSELASLSERRMSKLIDPGFSELPAFLVKNEGLNSGLMMAQVTAAALVSESKLLTHPGSTDSIPTNNEKEDHVSMGPLCALKARTVLDNSQYVLAIEALAACQALEFRKPLQPGRGGKLLYEAVRERVKPLDRDRYLSPDIEAVKDLITSGELHQRLTAAGLLEKEG